MNSAQDLQKIANRLRADVLEMVYRAGSGHVAGPLSSADLLSLLYFGDVVDFSTDKFVLSCGHYCPILYAALARSGAFPVEELSTFMHLGGRLPGHPERGMTPGVEVSAGPLGQGVSVAVGMALAMKLQFPPKIGEVMPKVFCLLSDGEMEEGQVWEALHFAVAKSLHNLIFIVDQNKIQIENYTHQIVTGDIAGKLEAFGLYTITTNGNDIGLLQEALARAKKVQAGPVAIVMDTVAGKGVSFMENKPIWHDRAPTKEELEQACNELGVEHV